MMKKGKFIVIEGVDGSGKETQAKLLVQYLEKQRVRVLYVDFPQYNGFFGKLVADYLRGEYGSIAQTSPFLISIIYALDRSTVREKIQTFLDSGGVVVANRYIPSNIAHQAANIQDESKQKEFIDWIQQLEYGELKLPKEDIVIYLDLPWEIGMQNNSKEDKSDIHEASSDHRQRTAKIYRLLQKQFDHWSVLNCADDKGKQRPPEQIHAELLSLLKLRNVKLSLDYSENP